MKLVLAFDFVLELVKYSLLLYVLFETKLRRKWFVGVAFGLWLIVLMTGIQQTEDLIALSYNLIPGIIITLVVVANEPIKRRILHILAIWVILITADSAIGMVLEILEDRMFLEKVPQEINWIINNLISISILLTICGVKKKRWMKDNRIFQLITKAMLYLCIAVMMIALPATVSGLAYFAEGINDPILTKKVQILTAIFLFSMIALAVFIIYVNDMNKKMKKYLEMEKTLKDTQKNYYEAMLAKEEDTRRFRHDVMNHLIALGELTKKGQVEPVADYVEEMQGNIVKIQQKCYSVGNTIIDSFLNYYVQMLDEEVEVKVTGCLTKELSISDVELCTIFSNLIKNSVEELKKPSESGKYLKIKVNSGQQAFQMEISNSISKQTEEIKGDLPKTTKKDKKNHGIGLRNVKETVEKNHGTFQWGVEDSCFRTVVTLPLKCNC